MPVIHRYNAEVLNNDVEQRYGIFKTSRFHLPEGGKIVYKTLNIIYIYDSINFHFPFKK